jgi:hypothetical protein
MVMVVVVVVTTVMVTKHERNRARYDGDAIAGQRIEITRPHPIDISAQLYCLVEGECSGTRYQ